MTSTSHVPIGLVIAAVALAVAVPASAADDRQLPLDLHLRTQGWYQWVEDGAPDGTGALHDFMLRRVYLALSGPARGARRAARRSRQHGRST